MLVGLAGLAHFCEALDVKYLVVWSRGPISQWPSFLQFSAGLGHLGPLITKDERHLGWGRGFLQPSQVGVSRPWSWDAPRSGFDLVPPRSPQEGTVWTTVQSSQKIDDGCFLRNMPVAYCCIHDALESWSKSGSCKRGYVNSSTLGDGSRLSQDLWIDLWLYLGWTSVCQLFWGSVEYQRFDP